MRFCCVTCALLLCYCGHDNCYRNAWNYTDYDVERDLELPSGLSVDLNGNTVDLIELDQQTDDLETCLGIPIKRDCLTVYFPEDWYVSPCSGKQLFPCDVGDQPCFDKDLEPTVDCPCACRGIRQDDNYIITTPNLELYKARLSEVVTGEFYVWDKPYITQCL